MITYTVLTSKKQEVHKKEAQEALTNIQEVCEKEDKWLFIDGEQYNPDKLTEETLENSNIITLTNRLTGG